MGAAAGAALGAAAGSPGLGAAAGAGAGLLAGTAIGSNNCRGLRRQRPAALRHGLYAVHVWGTATAYRARHRPPRRPIPLTPTAIPIRLRPTTRPIPTRIPVMSGSGSASAATGRAA
ncbi:MAG: hypothetical protein WDO24_16380 [Pseudomonadota bacterium]